MEIHEISYLVIAIVRFYHLQVEFVTSQEQHADSTQALMSDSNKICGQP